MKRLLERTDVKVLSRNESTGYIAATCGADPEFITMYKPNANKNPMPWESDYEAVRIICKPGQEGVEMYKYGKSKTLHWNTNCAKANASQDPVKVNRLEAVLDGHKECKNCWNRTRSIQN